MREAAKKFQIDKYVLSRRQTGVITKQERKTSLTPEIELDLSNKIKIMAKWGFALTKNEILDTIQSCVEENGLHTQFKNGRPGNYWFRSFCQRHKLS